MQELKLKLKVEAKAKVKVKATSNVEVDAETEVKAKAKVNAEAKAEVKAEVKAKASKAKFESQTKHNGGTPDQHDGGMCPKWPKSNFKANSKASRHDGYVCITGEWGEAANRTLLPLGYSLRTLIS